MVAPYGRFMMVTDLARSCEECGDDISDRRPNARFCADHGTPLAAQHRLNERIRAARPLKSCEECGKPIVGRPPYARYCHKHSTRQAIERRQTEKARAARPQKVCLVCGGEIVGRPPNADYCLEHNTKQAALLRYADNRKKARAAKERAAPLCKHTEDGKKCGKPIKDRHVNAWYCAAHATPEAYAIRRGGSGQAQGRTCAESGCDRDISDLHGKARYCPEHSGVNSAARRWREKLRLARGPRTCALPQCGESIEERHPVAKYCEKHSTPAARTQRYNEWAEAKRPARTCAEADCVEDISDRTLNFRYCPKHSGQANGVRRYLAKAQQGTPRPARKCKVVECPENISDLHFNARFCLKHATRIDGQRVNKGQVKTVAAERVCRVCGKDISHLRSYAVYCEEDGGKAGTKGRYRDAIASSKVGRTCTENECEVDISHLGPAAILCETHGSGLWTARRHYARVKAGRPPRQCKECGKDISERGGGAQYCPDHADIVRQYRNAAKVARLDRKCAVCGDEMGDRPPGAVLCENHGGLAAVRSRHYGTVRYNQTAQAFRDSIEGHAKRIASAHARRHAPGDIKNIERLARWALEQMGAGNPVPCGICGELIVGAGDFEIDHIVPITKDGTHDSDNLQPSHGSCNARKGNRLTGALRA